MGKEEITEAFQNLPPSLQQEVLDFLYFLCHRAEREQAGQWTQFSLWAALEGMEEEPPMYTLEDLKVVFR